MFRPLGTVQLREAVEEGGEVTLPVMGGEEEQAAGTAESAPQVELEEVCPNPLPEQQEQARPFPRTAVVRLWVVMAPFWDRETWDCKPDERLPEGFFAAAGARVTERFGQARPLGTLADPTGWLAGRAVEWDRTRSYVGTALLLDLGEDLGRSATSADQLEPELDGDLPRDDRDPPPLGEAGQPVEAPGE